MANASITVELESDDAAGGDLQLYQFIEELTAVRQALRQTERDVLRRDEAAVRYHVTNLSHSSPAKITITMSSREPAYVDIPKRISKRFGYTIEAIRRNHRYAERLNLRTLETLKALSAPASKHNIQVVVSTDPKHSVRLNKEFVHNVSRLIAGDERERDELVGRVERIDIHNKSAFDIYPLVGPQRVRCSAPKRFEAEILAAAGKYVAVEGVALYRKDSPFPYAMRVDFIHPRKPDSELPLMQELHGIAPNATEGLPSEVFVRNLRNADW